MLFLDEKMLNQVTIIKSTREFEKRMETTSPEQLIIIWCFAPCSTTSRKMAETIADKYPLIDFWQMNADKCKDFIELFNITRIPSVMAWKNKKLLHLEEYVSLDSVENIIAHKNHSPPVPGVFASFVSTWHIIFLEMSSIFYQFIDKVLLNHGYLFRVLPVGFAVFYLVFVFLLSYWILFRTESMEFSVFTIDKSFDQIGWFLKALILAVYVPLLLFAPVLFEDIIGFFDRTWTRFCAWAELPTN